ncbi:DcrB-related protein [Pantoea sp. FN0305]|uniref:DcrB-related protein n=1 Tax=Pantoea sp. FN0305 TaxID=3418559 RepID=UPI003CE862C9
MPARKNSMTICTLQEATLEIPDIYKDRTINLFVLSENSASDFSFVVSRGTAKFDDKVQSVAARLIKELELTVQKFSLVSSSMTVIDGMPAAEIFCHFESNNARVWQKQTIVLLDDRPAGKKMVSYIGSCPDSFNEYYQKQYAEILKSIKFHRYGNSNFISEVVPANAQDVFFVIDTDLRQLSVFEGLHALYQHVNLQRALNGQYLFYSSAGHPLHIAAVADSDPVRYGLWTSSPEDFQPLSSLLPVCRSVSGPEALNSVDKINKFISDK